MEKHIVEDSVVFTDFPPQYSKSEWWISDRGLEIIAGWRSSGASIREIAANMGVSQQTFKKWRVKYPKLEEALTVSGEVAIIRVENALFKRAVGYQYHEVTQELIEGQMRVTKIVTKEVAPDVKAILAFLYNRKGESWRAIQEPIDTDSPMIQNAEDVLVRIRDVANAHGSPPPASPLASGAEDGSTPDYEAEAQEKPKEKVE